MTDIDPFQISAIVPDFQAQNDGYNAASANTRARLRAEPDVPYGPAPRQRLDLFFPEGELTGRPVHAFIHGGYWRSRAKEEYAFVADGIVATGAIAAMIEYSLLPQQRMATLVDEVREAVRWLVRHAHEFGGDATQLSASGHSAGAHLCAYLASSGALEASPPDLPVRSVLLLSGIYDLDPITTSYLQPELQLTPDEATGWSPLAGTPSPGVHFTIAVGEDETLPFLQQAQSYAEWLRRGGAMAEHVSVANHEHMSIVRELGYVDRPVGRLLVETIERSRRER